MYSVAAIRPALQAPSVLLRLPWEEAVVVRIAHYDRSMATDRPMSTQKATTVIEHELEQRTSVGDSSATRSDPRRRRRWLRDLDSPLGSELEDAGTLSCHELVELAVQPLRERGSSATIEEWWEYTYRRGWIEEHGDNRCRLTATGLAGLHARRRSDAVIDHGALGRAILKWLLPAGAVGASAYVAGRYPASAAVIVIIVLGVAVGLILVAPVMRWVSRAMARQEARRACDWLDGHAVSLARGGARPTYSVKRLYCDDDRSAPGFPTA